MQHIKTHRRFFSTERKDHLFGLALALPALIVLFVTIFLPILKGVYVSFCEYKLATLNNPKWNDFKNYASLFKKGEIWMYFGNTFVYVFFTVSVQFFAGFGLALLLNSGVRGQRAFRGLFLIPWTVPSIVVALLWRWMLHQQFGVLNYLFYQLGLLPTVNMSWTLQPAPAMASVVAAAAWRQMPYMMVMMLAALQSVDRTQVEASMIDGANAWQTLRFVKLPAIRPVIISSLWIAIMSNFQMYTIIVNMTGGGPVKATTTLSLAAYKSAFQSYNFGEGAAIGVMWMALLGVITFISNRLSDKYTIAE